MRWTYKSVFAFFNEFGNYGLDECTMVMSSPAIKQVLKQTEKFDVILMEQFDHDCLRGLAWKLDAPVVALSSCPMLPWHYERFGQPHNPSYIPNYYMDGSDEMSFSQRINNWITTHAFRLMYK